VSQSLTVQSLEPDATNFPSGENATAQTWSEWPSSVCKAALQADSTFGGLQIQLGTRSLKVFLIILVSGAKIIAEE
jgi:hypothetical protein